MTSAITKGNVAAMAIEKGLELAAAATRALGSAIVSSTQNAINFEKALKDIKTISPASDMEALSKQLLKVSSSWGIDQMTVAAAQYDIMSSGITDTADAMKVLEGASALAVGTGASVAETSKTVTAAMNAWGMSAADVGQITDSLAITTQDGVVRMSELGPVFGQIAATAAAGGVSLQELNASVAALTLGGTPAAQAGTQLKAVISGLLKPSEELASAFEKQAGQSTAAYLKTNGLAKTLEVLKVVTKGNAEEASRLFGSQEAVSGLLPLITSQSENFTKSLNKQNAAIKDGGKVTKEMADIQMESAGKQMDKLNASVTALSTEFGKTFVPGVAAGAGAITGLVETLRDFLAENEKTFTAVGAKIAEFIKRAEEIAKAVAASDEFQWALSALRDLANEVFAELGAAFTRVQKFAETAFSDMGISQDEYLEALTILKDLAGLYFKALIGYFENMAKNAIIWYAGISKAVSLTVEAFQNMRDGILTVFSEITGRWASTLQAVVNGYNTLANALGTDIFSKQIASIQSAATAMKDLSNTYSVEGQAAERAAAVQEKATQKRNEANSSRITSKLIQEEEAAAADAAANKIQAASNKEAQGKDKVITKNKEVGESRKKAADEAKKAAEEEARIADENSRNSEGNLETKIDNYRRYYDSFSGDTAEHIKEYKEAFKKEDELEKQRIQDNADNAAANLESREDNFRSNFDSFAKGVVEVETDLAEELEELDDRKAKERIEKAKSFYADFSNIVNGLSSAKDFAPKEEEAKKVDSKDKEKAIEDKYSGEDTEVANAKKIEEAKAADAKKALDEKIKTEQDALKKKWQTEDDRASDVAASTRENISAQQEALKRLWQDTDAGNKDSAEAEKAAKAEALASLKASWEAEDARLGEVTKDQKKAIDAARKSQEKAIESNFKASSSAVADLSNSEKLALDRKREAQLKAIEENGLKAAGVNDKLTATERTAKADQREADLKAIEDKATSEVTAVKELSAVEKVNADIKAANEKKAREDKKAAEIKAVQDIAAAENAEIAKKAEAKKADKELLDKASKTANGIADMMSKIKGPVGEIGSMVAGAAALVFQLPDIMKGIPQMVTDLVKAIPTVVLALIEEVPNLITSLVEAIPGLVASLLESIPKITQKLTELMTDPMFFINIVKSLFNAIVKIDWLKIGGNLLKGIWDGLSGVGNMFKDFGNEVWKGLKSAFKAVTNFLGDLIPNLWGKGRIENWLGFDIPFVRFAQGGIVGGKAKVKGDSPLNDTVPALLSPGEIVVPRSVVSKGMGGVNQWLNSLGQAGLSTFEAGSGIDMIGGRERHWNPFSWIKKKVEKVGDWIASTPVIGDIIGGAGDAINWVYRQVTEGALTPIINQLPSPIPEAWNFIKGELAPSRILQTMKDLIANPLGAVTDIFGRNWEGLLKPLLKSVGVPMYAGGISAGGMTMLSPGELVLPKSFTEKAKPIHAANIGVSRASESPYNSIGEALAKAFDQEIVITIDGREVARAVRGEVQRGFKL
jgi:TP901 family phage tail tape measure protein